MDEEGHMAYLPAGISLEELLTAAEDLQAMLPTPMASRPSEWGGQVAALSLVSAHPCHKQGQVVLPTTLPA